MKISKETLEVLVHFLKKEDRVMQSRVTVENLRERYDAKMATLLLLRRRETPKAFAALWPAKISGWLELGTVWVHPAARGHGYAQRVFDGCVDLVPENKSLFLITRSIKIAHIAISRGWIEWNVGDWSKDFLWKRIAEPWGRKLPKATRVFPRGGRLFVRDYEYKTLSV